MYIIINLTTAMYLNGMVNMKTKKLTEKAIWFLMNTVCVGLGATLVWGIILAIGNVSEADWVQWLLP